MDWAYVDLTRDDEEEEPEWWDELEPRELQLLQAFLDGQFGTEGVPVSATGATSLSEFAERFGVELKRFVRDAWMR